MKVFFVLLLASWPSCKAQNSDYIMYDLPDPVSEKLNERINYVSSKNEAAKFVGLLNKVDHERYNLALIDYDAKTQKKVLGLLSTVVLKSNRAIQLGEQVVPLITNEDILFANLGKEKMPDGRIAKKRVIFNYNGFSIAFNRVGTIFDDET